MAGSGGQELMGDRGARPRAATDDDRCLYDFADDLRVGSTVIHEHEPPPEEAKDLLADPKKLLDMIFNYTYVAWARGRTGGSLAEEEEEAP